MNLESQIISIDGRGIQVAQRPGSGPAVLLVHGITTYGFIWRKVLPQLPEDAHLIVVDLLGCGHSEKPLDVPYSIKNHAGWLFQIMDRLELHQFHLVGHDVGGGIAQIMAVRHPERILTLSLLNSVAYDFWPVQPIIAMRTPIIRQMAMATLDLGMFRMIVSRGLFHQEMLTDELMDHFWMPMREASGRKAFLHFARSLDNQNLMEIADDLKKLTVPTLILRGAADPYLSATISHRLHEGIPGSNLVILERGSHFFQEDIPVEIGQALIQHFES